MQNLCAELQDFMQGHDFTSVEQFRGKALPYFTTHSDLVARQQVTECSLKVTEYSLKVTECSLTFTECSLGGHQAQEGGQGGA
jgi:hypothetical protein